MLDGPAPPVGQGWIVTDPDAARAVVRAAKNNGYDFIKVYNRLSAPVFEAIAGEAAAQGLPVVGHGVRSIGLPKALFEGQVMVAHAEEFYYTAFAYKPDDAKLPQVVGQVLQSGAYVIPNLSAFDVIVRQWGQPEKLGEFLADPRTRGMAPATLLAWIDKPYVHSPPPAPADAYAFLKRFTKALSDSGVPLMTGTDSPIIPGLIPGASIRDDLRTLVDAGLTRFQALSAATRVPGEFAVKQLHAERRFGVVEPGTAADLLLVLCNPLDDLACLERSAGVMANGHWKSRAELDAVLEANRMANRRKLNSLWLRTQ
jgi:hypothetical protein